MAISVQTITILGTAYPWEIGASAANPGSAGTLVAYNSQFCDGSATASATAGQNSAYLYGKQHAHAGETAPTRIAVSPGNVVTLVYYSGMVQSGGGGAGDSGPGGSPVSSGTSPLPAGGCDGDTMASNVIPGFSQFNGTGTVNTSGTTVTWVSGTLFNGTMVNNPMWINGVKYFVASITSTTVLVLKTTAGTQTGVTFYVWGAQTAIGGLIGAFTDSSRNVLSTFDFGSWLGNLTFAISSAVETSGSVVTLTGAFSGTAQYTVGMTVYITGMTALTWLNGQTVTITAVTATTLVFNDPTAHGAQTSLASAGFALGGSITLLAPPTAAWLSLGINDTQLYDNTGSFVFTAIVNDAAGSLPGSWLGSSYPFKHFPHGHSGDTTFVPDVASGMSAHVAEVIPHAQIPTSPLAKPFVGQLFPRGAQNCGGNSGSTGQNFPY